MVGAVDITTDKHIDEAFERSKQHDNDPVAISVKHISTENLIVIHLSNARRLVLPVEDIQALNQATHEQLSHHEIIGIGRGISFPDIDADLFVPALIQGIYGSERWMRQLEVRTTPPMQAAA